MAGRAADNRAEADNCKMCIRDRGDGVLTTERKESASVELSERKKQILKAIIGDYIRTAEPVGSKALTCLLYTSRCV